jgi:hypothetical protein
MKKLLTLILAAVFFLVAVHRPAFAQETATPTVVQSTGAIRVNFKSKLRATIYDRQTGRLLCATPCTADVPPNAPLRVVLEGGEEEPHDFAVTGDGGGMVDVEIKRGGTGALVGGIILTATGGSVTLGGLVVVLIASVADNDRSLFREGADEIRTVGIVMLVAGVGMMVGGVVLLSGRSMEATTRQKPTPGYGSRAEVLRSDMAAAGRRDPITAPAPTQLGWSFSF